MNNIKILYYLIGNDSSIFLELKRLGYKQSIDKSKYVCWFRIINQKIKKLNFISISQEKRHFKEGELIINENEKLFIDNDNNKIVLYSLDNDNNIDINNIKLCCDYWDN